MVSVGKHCPNLDSVEWTEMCLIVYATALR